MTYFERTIGIVGLLALVSCTDFEGPSETQETTKHAQKVEEFAKYDVRRPSRPIGELADRTLTLAKILDDTLEASHEEIQTALDSLPGAAPSERNGAAGSQVLEVAPSFGLVGVTPRWPRALPERESRAFRSS